MINQQIKGGFSTGSPDISTAGELTDIRQLLCRKGQTILMVTHNSECTLMLRDGGGESSNCRQPSLATAC